MVRPVEGPLWIVLGAVFALVLNAAALLLPVGLLASPFHAVGSLLALGWLIAGLVTSQASRSWVILGSVLLLGAQLVGYGLGAAHAVALLALVGVPLWALAAAHPIIRLPELTMALPLGSAVALALAFLLAMSDVVVPMDPLVHWGWVYVWGLTVFCVALWHWWGSDLPEERLYRAEAVLLGWVGAVILIPVRLTVIPLMPLAHFGPLAAVADATAIAMLFASAWGARQVATSTSCNERMPL